MQADTRSEFTATPLGMTLSHLDKQARRAGTLVDLGFVVVHETQCLLPYREAALWLKDAGMAAWSGGVGSVRTGACVQWLTRWCQDRAVGSEPVLWDLRRVARDDETWRNCLSPWLLAVPLSQPDGSSGECFGVLLLARDSAFVPEEVGLLKAWLKVWTACYWRRRSRQGAWTWARLEPGSWGRKARAAVTATLGLAGFYSGEQLVLARQEPVPLARPIMTPAPDGTEPGARMAPTPSEGGDHGVEFRSCEIPGS